jgi:hypothetical protein
MPRSRRSFLASLALGVLLLLSAASLAGSAGAYPFNVGNKVWLDVDGDGIQEAGESGIAGVTVELVTADRAVLVDTTTTDGSGTYTLVGESPGAYRVRVNVPDGYQITQHNIGADDTLDSDFAPSGDDFRYSDVLEAATNLISTTIFDAGLTVQTSTANTGNFVWLDLDGNGVQDGGEPGVAGVAVELWNAAKTERLASTTTSALGTYSLTSPYPTLLRLRVIPPAGHQFAPRDATTDVSDSDIESSGGDYSFTEPFVASTSGSGNAHDAGLMLPTSPVNVGNLVWRDLDGDGVRDAGEPGLEGVTVQLWNAEQTEILDTAVTDASGIYTVTGEVPGNFRIRVIAPAGYHYSPADNILDDSIDSDVFGTTPNAGFSNAFHLGSNVLSVTNRDSGLMLPVSPVSIGDSVWFDANYDGVQGAGEASAAGITVELWDATRTQLIDTAVTSVNGAYVLGGQVPGAYRLRISVAPADGLQFTRKNVGADVTLDSEIHPWGPEYRFSDPIYLSSNVLSTTNRDVGMLAQVIPEPGASLAGAFGVFVLAGLGRSRRRAAG